MNKDLAIAVKAAVEGGAAIMEIYAKEDLGVEYKEDESPLTLADKECNDVINSYLIKTMHPIISEENKQLEFEERKDWDTCWIVDPLDGTKEFVKRNGEFTVNIALVKQGKPLLGVIYVPDTKELYVADVAQKKAGKFILDQHEVIVADLDMDANLIGPKAANTELVRVVGSRSHMSEATETFVESLKGPRGESMVIIGGSGTGKSVALKCVLGLIKPDSGTITVDGKDADKGDRDAFLARLACCFRAARCLIHCPSGKMWPSAFCAER